MTILTTFVTISGEIHPTTVVKMSCKGGLISVISPNRFFFYISHHIILLHTFSKSHIWHLNHCMSNYTCIIDTAYVVMFNCSE